MAQDDEVLPIPEQPPAGAMVVFKGSSSTTVPTGNVRGSMTCAVPIADAYLQPFSLVHTQNIEDKLQNSICYRTDYRDIEFNYEY